MVRGRRLPSVRMDEALAAAKDPYRDTLPGLLAQRRVLVGRLRSLLGELVALERLIAFRSKRMVGSTYPTGPGPLGRWLGRRAWRRVLRDHGACLSEVLDGVYSVAEHDPARDGGEPRKQARYAGQAKRTGQTGRAGQTEQTGQAEQTGASLAGLPARLAQPPPKTILRRQEEGLPSQEAW